MIAYDKNLTFLHSQATLTFGGGPRSGVCGRRRIWRVLSYFVLFYTYFFIIIPPKNFYES